MKKLAILAIIALLFAAAQDASARGGFSSGGGRSSGFSSSRSYGGSSRSYSGGSSSRSYSSPRSYGNRSYSRTTRVYHYSGGYVHPYGMYGGYGMGYGYSNGLITGMILNGLMHPQGTVLYSGGGYGGQALLYPNGAVVDGSGNQVGTYINGQFTAVQNGPMLAQPVPADAQQQQVSGDSETSFWESLLTAIGVCVAGFLLIILFVIVVE